MTPLRYCGVATALVSTVFSGAVGRSGVYFTELFGN